MNVYRQSLHHFARRQPYPRFVVKRTAPTPGLQYWRHSSQSAAVPPSMPEERRRRVEETVKTIELEGAQKVLHSLLGNPNDWSLEQLRKLLVPDHLIMPGTVYHFSDCMLEGMLPNGRTTSFPLLREDELHLMGEPYKNWAPEPWNKVEYSLLDKVFTEFFGNYHSGIYIPARLQPLRARLWAGMVPMSGGRWKEKRLNDPKNFQQFHDLMMDILQIFLFMNNERTQDILRTWFNWLAREYGFFESAINLRREDLGIKDRMNIKEMWAEYMQAVISTMTNRAHRWLVDRVDEIQTQSKIEYEAALYSAGTNAAAITAAGKTFFERIQDLNLAITKADYTLSIPMQGCNGYSPSTIGTNDLSLDLRREAYYKISDSKSWESYRPFQDHTNRDAGYRDRDALMRVFEEGRINRSKVRKSFRGAPPTLGEEQWISIVKSRINWYLRYGGDPQRQTWGFVCYRLFYDQTPKEWAEFKDKFEADLRKSTQWIQGADDVINTAGVQWVDGKELGIPEGDIEAAKRHFATFPQSAEFKRLMWKEDFLIVDQLSYLSYKIPIKEKVGPYGDKGGHVLLVDMKAYDQESIEKTSPGFNGNVRVLTSLVINELYPLLVSLNLRPKDIWPLARLHLNQVYVGPTTTTQEVMWENSRTYMGSMLPNMFEFIKKKQAEAKTGEATASKS